MTALREIAGYLPDRRVPLEELLADWRLPPSTLDTLRRSYGYSEVRRQKPGETLLDLLAQAAHGLSALPGRADRVRYLLYARTVPVSLPHPVNPLPELCDLLGLRAATAFAVGHHGCAAGLLAIDVAGRLLTADGDPDALALIVAGEQVFTLDESLRPEARIFGEASAACLVSADGPRDRVLSYVTLQCGDLDHWAADRADRADHAERFAREYTPLMGQVIRAAAERAGLRVDELRLVLPHNVNTRSWRKVCRELGLPPTVVLLDNVPLIGHTFAADTFLNYRTAIKNGLLSAGDRYLVVSAGYGAIFSAMVLEH
ncbi:3-oxoacyl-[acyl-carrier-protein] synthase III C-terminal domain-containing protein [Actinophytocola xanthii]|uniref:Beta-ketoacyl-[acyl-carrier-protein] synthase III C-terminal domain-containing protein n=1 Tax=Actinophytocola xanthii TaxID=1912961 RepID=A0A1Q8CXW5_9PSEU|nr:3-oxoacyl-[acyl-carrier-protein] synthase III C-terminal domain-containing protein [Actinophytocola xanthii]OLF19201.1 hypothetical protein BU204_02265 [Actinophytocola xanthii]